MKELLNVSSNSSVVERDGAAVGLVEVVLTFSEPRWRVDEAGGVYKQRETMDFRFGGTPRALREFAKLLNGVADDAEALARRTTFAPEPPK